MEEAFKSFSLYLKAKSLVSSKRQWRWILERSMAYFLSLISILVSPKAAIPLNVALCFRLTIPRTEATEMRTLLGVKRDRLQTFMLHTAKMAILGFSQINEISGGCFNVPLKQNKLFFHRFGCPDRGEIYLSHCQRENTRHRRRSFRGIEMLFRQPDCEERTSQVHFHCS